VIVSLFQLCIIIYTIIIFQKVVCIAGKGSQAALVNSYHIKSTFLVQSNRKEKPVVYLDKEKKNEKEKERAPYSRIYTIVKVHCLQNNR
jgi:hypothetical protein